jgi:hypothetical protein
MWRKAAGAPLGFWASFRFMPALIALTALSVASGCERAASRPAVGASGQATIVSDLPPDSPAVAQVEATIGREIVTTRSEAAFELDRVRGDRFRSVRAWRNLIFVADLDQPCATTERVIEILGPDLTRDFQAGRRFYSLYSDVWARGQTVLVLAARGEAALAAAIRGQGDRLYDAFDQRVTHQILALQYLAGEQDDVRRRLEQSYGWSIRIPVGYRIGEDPGARFVRFLRREGGAHLLFVHWQDGVVALPSPDACLAIRARLVAQAYDGDTIDSTRTRSEQVDFLGRRALKLIGVWQNSKYTIGGPFHTYCFCEDGRFTMLDLAVFDPTGNKVALLRQTEAIALTYRDHRQDRN